MELDLTRMVANEQATHPLPLLDLPPLQRLLPQQPHPHSQPHKIHPMAMASNQLYQASLIPGPTNFQVRRKLKVTMALLKLHPLPTQLLIRQKNLVKSLTVSQLWARAKVKLALLMEAKLTVVSVDVMGQESSLLLLLEVSVL